MNQVLASWTAQLTGMTGSLLGFVAALAVAAIIVTVIKGLFIDEDRKTSEVIVRILVIIGFVIVAALATTIVGGIV